MRWCEKVNGVMFGVCACLLIGCGDEDTSNKSGQQPVDMGSVVEMGGFDLGPKREVGELCAMSAGCVDGAKCVTAGNPGEQERCYYTCAETGRICAQNGALCAATEATISVCYTGGEAMIGEACARSTQCATGLTCVNLGEDNVVCQKACHTQDMVCGSGETCKIVAGDRGYCEAS